MQTSLCSLHLTFLICAVLWTREISAQDFLRKWDFDQDGKNDSVYFEYTGGAHCCYHIRIKTSHDNKVWKFDDNMDGGYIMGPDDSQPEHFNIMNYDGDSAPEIYMEINTYNGDYSGGGRQVLLDYEGNYFFKKPFDIYAYQRSLDSISCSGVTGISGNYIARTDDAIETLVLHNSSIADYGAQPRGMGAWEQYYDGKWELKHDTLIITYFFERQWPTWESTAHESLEKPIVHQYIYVKDECMFREIGVNEEVVFYKE
jgi:hypothetical protein